MPTPIEVDDYSKAFGVSAARANANLTAQLRGARIVEELQGALGPDYAGVWFDNEAGQFVVPVLGDSSREQANRTRVADEFAKLDLASDYRTESVKFSWDGLVIAQETLDKELTSDAIAPGMAQTSSDVKRNAVIITVAANITKQEEAEIARLASDLQVSAKVVKSDRPTLAAKPLACKPVHELHYCDPPLRGGTGIDWWQQGTICTAGFRARGFDAKWYVLTGGHCVGHWSNPVKHWSAVDYDFDEYYLGELKGLKWPLGDWAKIGATGSEWDTGSWPSQVVKWTAYNQSGGIINEHNPINGEGTPWVGQIVYHSGNTTGSDWHEVQATNETIWQSPGPVQIQHTARVTKGCLGPGDSGGPIYAGTTAYGLVSTGYIEEIGGEQKYCHPQNEYWFVKIKNATADQNVTVVGGPPGASTGTYTSLQPYQATLHGQVQPNQWSTDYRFEWGKTCYCQHSSEDSAGSGTSWVSNNQIATDLDPARQYKYRIRANNALGTTYGADGFFTTPPAPPEAVTESHSNIRVEEETGQATLHGRVNPGGADTDYRFEWGTVASDEFANNAPIPDGNTGDGIALESVQAGIEDLKGSTEYHYRLRAENSEGTDTGAVKTFETPDWRPEISIGGHTAPYVEEDTGKIKLKGEVNPNGFTTAYEFRWATQAEYENEEFNHVVYGGEIGNCICVEAVEEMAEGLKGSTTYHYRLIASNAEGWRASTEDKSFTTPNWKPSIQGTSAIAVGAEQATLAARVRPKGFTTSYIFEWATEEELEAEEGYAHGVEGQGFGALGDEVEATATIEGLERWETYHFRLTAESSQGSATATDAEFTTSSGGFRASGDPTAVAAAPAGEGFLTVYIPESTPTIECVSSPLQGTLEGGAEFGAAGDSLVLEPSEEFDCGEGQFWLEMNECGFEFDPGYGKGTSFDGEFNIGPPGCGPIYLGTAWGCSTYIPPQVGRTASFVNEGQGPAGKVKVSVSTVDLRSYREGALCDWPLSSADGHFSASWLLEGEGEEAEGVRVSPFVDGGPGVSGEVIEAGVHTAVVQGSIETLGAGAIWGIEYGLTSEYGLLASGGVIPGGGEDVVDVEAEISDLQPEAAYHYRLVGVNEGGVTYGEEQTFATPPLHRPLLSSEAYPAEVSGTAGGEDLLTIESFPGLFFECEAAHLSGEILAATPLSSSLGAEYEGCTSALGEATIETNSCGYELHIENAGSPYTGGLGIDCTEEGDAIELIAPGCTISLPEQGVVDGLDLSIAGEGPSRVIEIDGAAEGLTYIAEGFVCALAEIPAEGEDANLSATMTLEGDAGEEEVGLSVFGDEIESIGLFAEGEESEEEESRPRLASEGYPGTVFIDQSGEEPLSFDSTPELGLSCEPIQLQAGIAAATPSLTLATEYDDCTSSFGEATIEMNSCGYELHIDNAGPPYTGGLGIECTEEGDVMELIAPGCTISLPEQPSAGGLDLQTAGEGAGRVLDVDGASAGLTYETEGFICEIAELPEEGKDANVGLDAVLYRVN